MKKTESWSTVAEVIVKVKVIYFLRHELVIIIIHAEHVVHSAWILF